MRITTPDRCEDNGPATAIQNIRAFIEAAPGELAALCSRQTRRHGGWREKSVYEPPRDA